MVDQVGAPGPVKNRAGLVLTDPESRAQLYDLDKVTAWNKQRPGWGTYKWRLEGGLPPFSAMRRDMLQLAEDGGLMVEQRRVVKVGVAGPEALTRGQSMSLAELRKANLVTVADHNGPVSITPAGQRVLRQWAKVAA
jgi:hypothetical protein